MLDELCNLNDLVEFKISIVDSVLLFLLVSLGFVEVLQDEGGSSGHHLDCALSVLDHNFDVNLDSSPVLGCFLDIFTDLLWGQTEG